MSVFAETCGRILGVIAFNIFMFLNRQHITSQCCMHWVKAANLPFLLYLSSFIIHKLYVFSTINFFFFFFFFFARFKASEKWVCF